MQPRIQKYPQIDLFSYLVYSQIYLNSLTNGHHFGYLTKSIKKNCGCKAKSNKKFHVNILFKLNTGDLMTLTIEQLDWKTRMNIALNVAQGK